MRVVIASTIAPFINGGAALIVDWLEAMLLRAGHEVETLRLPFSAHWRSIPGQTMALREVDLDAVCDRLIAIRTPAYVIRHRAKVTWFIHHHRGAYDLWGTQYQDIPDTVYGRSVRDMIVAADNVALRESIRLFTNSHVVGERLRRYNGLESSVLFPPLFEPERFRCETAEDYVYYPSRLVHHKRQHLAIEALAHTRTPVRLVVTGAPGEPDYLEKLVALTRQLGLADRVVIEPTWISEERKIDWYSRALGTVYVPFDEDSYGYPSLESYAARKPVISVTDAGGTRELIVDGVTGLMTEPAPAALGAAFDRLYTDRAAAAAMGEAGARRVHDLGIDWPTTLGKLLG